MHVADAVHGVHAAHAAHAAHAVSGIGVDVSVDADASKQRFDPAPGNLDGAPVS
ncbi:hypothetical protein [Sorangium sp. So ce1151]|uniref:hypothetical protein n=1 Tax=Sorangium sp. So ce1151 TaxID=3133332 RepID=UPI003F5F30EB